MKTRWCSPRRPRLSCARPTYPVNTSSSSRYAGEGRQWPKVAVVKAPVLVFGLSSYPLGQYVDHHCHPASSQEPVSSHKSVQIVEKTPMNETGWTNELPERRLELVCPEDVSWSSRSQTSFCRSRMILRVDLALIISFLLH